MLFLISLVIASAFVFLFKKPLKKHPYIFYAVAAVISYIVSAATLRGLPEFVNTYIIGMFSRGVMGTALWAIVMWTGALPNGSKSIKALMPVRGELSIIAAILTLGHNIGFVYQNLYNEYISIPRPADMSIISIGVGFFLNASFATMLININMANMIMPLKSMASVSPIPLNPIAVPINIVIAVASIKPTTHGRIPPRNAFTPAYFIKLRIRAAIMRMIINDGNTTPSVARIAPRKPPCDEPTKVAILTAIGPGVDSATAIIFSSSSSVSQPCIKTFSRIREIIPYPPPKENAPI